MAEVTADRWVPARLRINGRSVQVDRATALAMADWEISVRYSLALPPYQTVSAATLRQLLDAYDQMLAAHAALAADGQGAHVHSYPRPPLPLSADDQADFAAYAAHPFLEPPDA